MKNNVKVLICIWLLIAIAVGIRGIVKIQAATTPITQSERVK
jgi:hypothetical protein